MFRPRVVLVHGSATDHTTWSIQLGSSLADRFELVAPDRNFTRSTVAEHAADLAAVVGEAALVVGSSFGAVIALELARTQPARVPGMILIEPPLPPSDDPELASGQRAFYAEFERRIADEGGPAAGEFFLRTVLGPEAYERIPQAFRERSRERWAEIRADSAGPGGLPAALRRAGELHGAGHVARRRALRPAVPAHARGPRGRLAGCRPGHHPQGRPHVARRGAPPVCGGADRVRRRRSGSGKVRGPP